MYQNLGEVVNDQQESEGNKIPPRQLAGLFVVTMIENLLEILKKFKCNYENNVLPCIGWYCISVSSFRQENTREQYKKG